MRRDGKKRNSSINTMSHDAPTVSARFIYGPTTTHDGSATIHHDGATNAHDASTIRYGASTIQAGSVTTSHESARFSGCHATVPGEGGGYSHFFFIRRLGPSIYRSPPPPKKKEFQEPKNIFEILATPQNTPILYLGLKKDQKMHRNDP